MKKIRKLITLFLIPVLMTTFGIPTFATENKISNLKSELNLNQTINSKNYTLGDTFDISYNISSLMGINKNDYDEANSKDKEIVLVVDTSGSMNRKDITKAYRLVPLEYGIHLLKPYPIFEKTRYNKVTTNWDYYVMLEDGRECVVNYNAYGNKFISVDNDTFYLKYDRYGNMCAISDSNSRLEQAKKAAKKFVDKFKGKKNIKMSLVSYGNTGKVVHEITNELDRITSSIDSGLMADGGTNIGDGVRMANGLLNNGDDADKYMVLMTDGIPTAATCYKDVESKRTYHYNEYYRENFYDNPGGVILDGYGNPLKEFNVVNNPQYKFEYNPNNYIHYDENVIVNYGDDDYNNIALNYAKESLKRAHGNGVNNFVVGFSNGISRDKLTQIADAGNGYYREAMQGDELEDVYNRIADEINNPVVKDIEFKLNLPEGLVVEDIVSDISKESLKEKLNVTISEDGRSIKFKLDNISYNEEKDENGNVKYVVSKDQLDKFKFSLKVKANKSGEYTIGDKDSYGGINYTDVNGQYQEKAFGKETFKVKDDKEALTVENMGLFYKQSGKILNKDIKLMNGFRYEVGTVINIGDGQKAQDFIENDSILKSSISGIKKVAKSNLKLYSVEGDKIQLVKNIKKSGDNSIKIPKNTLKKNGKYILVEDIIHVDNNDKDKNFELKNTIELQNDKNKAIVNGDMNFKSLNGLPNLD